MENKKEVVDGGGSSSLDHLFGPKDSFSFSSSSASSTDIFRSIFSSPSAMQQGRDLVGKQVASGINGNPDNVTESSKGENSCGVNDKSNVLYQNEIMEPCYFSSSIYYGGQQHYSPRTSSSESQYSLKKDSGDNDPNGNNFNSASRGNWWQGSLYY